MAGSDRPVPFVATYRVQLTPDFTLADLVGVVPYLARLGISHVYTSPLLQATPGSEHGYDVIDHTRVSDELGGAAGLAALHETLATHGMSHVVDLVPNHMAVGDRGNRWWWDVLEHGAESRYAHHFDIEWDPDVPSLVDRVLVPVLGDRYAQELAAGSIVVERDDDRFVVRYGDNVFPVRPSTYREAEQALSGTVADVHALLERQHYRLAQWRTASEELDYRRFFDVTTLAGLRVEEAAVFAEVHALALEWVASGRVTGLRIDHPDGLRNPRAYFERLRAAAPDAWIVVEKILEHGEALRASWPVAGTTGYEAAALITALLVDDTAERAMTDGYAEFVGDATVYEEVAAESKRQVLNTVFGTELDRLAVALTSLSRQSLELRDFPRSVLRLAIAELLVGLPVYRTYIEAPEYRPAALDIEVVDAARRAAVAAGRAEEAAVDAVTAVLLGEITASGAANFVARFQQTAGPVMAKGLEDTAFYRYSRLLALNEVGADPARFGVSIEEFHTETAVRARDWPRSMVTSSTHDTKRSEDVRARLAVLAEVPEEWFAAAAAWREQAARFRSEVDGAVVPEPEFEHFVLQTLVGAWPIAEDRLLPTLTKAMREAKRATSWTAPHEQYEAAVHDYARGVLGDERLTAAIAAFARRIDPAGRSNALTQKVLTLTVPGVPDIYQGSELWTDSLVDPDNRRPVDYRRRETALTAVSGRPADPGRLADDGVGHGKLWIVQRTLATRARVLECFDAATPSGGYEPLSIDGSGARHAVAFRRGERVVVAGVRLPLGLERAGGWHDTAIDLPAGEWVDAYTDRVSPGGRLSAARLFDSWPVALLVRSAG